MKARALVTGGGGFLGRAIVEQLVGEGRCVRSYSRGAYPELEAAGVECVRGELEDAEAVRRACDGCGVVFHAAAKAGVWGSWESYYRPNVSGTRNVVRACRAAGVPFLVYTSSPSVVFDGGDMEGVDESVPYATRYRAHYPRSKALAEQAVREADGAGLRTVALRPHLIWGPRDNHLVPRILTRARWLRRIGRENKRVDSSYVEDAARAHVLAAARLEAGAEVGGRVYFISQGEPWPVWDLVNGILAAAGLPPVTRRVSRWKAELAAAVLENVYGMMGLGGEPRLTRFVVEELCAAHWFDIGAARRDLGYEPSVTISEGLARLRGWLRGDSRGA